MLAIGSLIMKATLYRPNQAPVNIAADGLRVAHEITGLPSVLDKVGNLLGCAVGMVDVLASGPGYVVYSVFDHDGEINEGAMLAAAGLTGVSFDLADEDAVLRGPLLVVERGE